MNNPELKSGRWKALCVELKRTLAPVCWICGRDIDLSLSGRDPMGWTADHIKPRSTHPHLTYDPANILPAHHKCNSKRGDKEMQTVNTSRRYG